MPLQQVFHLRSQSDLRYYTLRHLVEHKLSDIKLEKGKKNIHAQSVINGAHSSDSETIGRNAAHVTLQ